MDFSKYLSFADFKNINQQYLIKENPNDNSSRPNKKFYDISEIFFESVFNFLTDFKKKNGLKGIEYSEGHSTSLINTWKKFIL